MKRTALVTGATRGIERAVATQLQAAGIAVFVTGRDPTLLQALRQELGGSGAAADLADAKAVLGLSQEARRTLGHIVHELTFRPVVETNSLPGPRPPLNRRSVAANWRRRHFQRRWRLPPRGSYVLLLAVGLAMRVSAQTEYTADGAPTALEEEIRWLVNRGRFDSASENQAQGTAYNDVPASAGPLAPHRALILAARRHSEDMARHNLFQHDTIPGSAFYDPVTQPTPGDRMEAEGYAWNAYGENIAAGFPTGQAAHVGWWNSTGHRRNIYDAGFREIGNGYFYWGFSDYGHYYTMDLATSGNTHFFTDTVFHDANGDGAYDPGEGVAGVRVSLVVQGQPHSAFDQSTPAGSFAVPIQSIPAGAAVTVILVNPAATAVRLTVPRDYHSNPSVLLAPGAERAWGTFTQPTAATNLGFRNLTLLPPVAAGPALTLVRSGADVQLRWASEIGWEYLPQWSTDLVHWSDDSGSYQAGTGAVLGWTDVAPAATQAMKFYRVAARRGGGAPPPR
jgi:hypothetical protein